MEVVNSFLRRAEERFSEMDARLEAGLRDTCHLQEMKLSTLEEGVWRSLNELGERVQRLEEGRVAPQPDEELKQERREVLMAVAGFCVDLQRVKERCEKGMEELKGRMEAQPQVEERFQGELEQVREKHTRMEAELGGVSTKVEEELKARAQKAPGPSEAEKLLHWELEHLREQHCHVAAELAAIRSQVEEEGKARVESHAKIEEELKTRAHRTPLAALPGPSEAEELLHFELEQLRERMETELEALGAKVEQDLKESREQTVQVEPRWQRDLELLREQHCCVKAEVGAMKAKLEEDLSAIVESHKQLAPNLSEAEKRLQGELALLRAQHCRVDGELEAMRARLEQELKTLVESWKPVPGPSEAERRLQEELALLREQHYHADGRLGAMGARLEEELKARVDAREVEQRFQREVEFLREQRCCAEREMDAIKAKLEEVDAAGSAFHTLVVRKLSSDAPLAPTTSSAVPTVTGPSEEITQWGVEQLRMYMEGELGDLKARLEQELMVRADSREHPSGPSEVEAHLQNELELLRVQHTRVDEELEAVRAKLAEELQARAGPEPHVMQRELQLLREQHSRVDEELGAMRAKLEEAVSAASVGKPAQTAVQNRFLAEVQALEGRLVPSIMALQDLQAQACGSIGELRRLSALAAGAEPDEFQATGTTEPQSVTHSDTAGSETDLEGSSKTMKPFSGVIVQPQGAGISEQLQHLQCWKGRAGEELKELKATLVDEVEDLRCRQGKLQESVQALSSQLLADIQELRSNLAEATLVVDETRVQQQLQGAAIDALGLELGAARGVEARTSSPEPSPSRQLWRRYRAPSKSLHSEP